MTMQKRGRPSSASLAVIAPTGDRLLRCRPDAPDEVKAVFARIVSDAGAGHFRASDADPPRPLARVRRPCRPSHQG